jgi:cyclopropane fatty-acyl-phospholipid synthase-like methyltransferase
MLKSIDRVAEVGCGDGFGARIVRQQVHNLLVTDMDPIFIEDFEKLRDVNWPIEARVHDILQSPIGSNFDAIYSLDVMEHIPLENEGIYLSNICQSLKSTGIAIIGMPSQESQKYASKDSREGHVNCKSGEELRESLKQYFANVFVFSMNDEVVHTGFTPMAHYLIGLCCGIVHHEP